MDKKTFKDTNFGKAAEFTSSAKSMPVGEADYTFLGVKFSQENLSAGGTYTAAWALNKADNSVYRFGANGFLAAVGCFTAEQKKQWAKDNGAKTITIHCSVTPREDGNGTNKAWSTVGGAEEDDE